jgi:hypothetical protein
MQMARLQDGLAEAVPVSEKWPRIKEDLDLRGTLGTSKDVPVGFENIRLHFDVRGLVPCEYRDMSPA